jgi:hypothetical protein
VALGRPIASRIAVRPHWIAWIIVAKFALRDGNGKIALASVEWPRLVGKALSRTGRPIESSARLQFADPQASRAPSGAPPRIRVIFGDLPIGATREGRLAKILRGERGSPTISSPHKLNVISRRHIARKSLVIFNYINLLRIIQRPNS